MSGTNATDSGTKSAITSSNPATASPTTSKVGPTSAHVKHAPATDSHDPHAIYLTHSITEGTLDLAGNPLTVFTFQASETPWSTNDDRKMNPYKRAARIKTWKTDAYLGYIQYTNRHKLPRELPPGIVQIAIPFATKRRRDPHNYCGTVLKAIIDGLVNAKAWKDDTPEYVGHREPILWIPKYRSPSTALTSVYVTHPDKYMLVDGEWKVTS